MQFSFSYDLPHKKSKSDNWLPHFPNPADFRFNYYQLLEKAPKGIAKLPKHARKRVAVIGAGSGGMTAARELFRCGFDVTIYEASNRIGGRLYTRTNPLAQYKDDQTGMEMGAMRMPFFSLPGNHNCILEYYMLKEAGKHKAQCSQFPNPGSATGNTGIYMNEGHGPNNTYNKPKMILWKNNGFPDDPELKRLAKKTGDFISFFTSQVKDVYVENSDDWPRLWRKIVKHYESMTFDDLVMAARVKEMKDGNLGGFGMSAQEAELLYTIGTGDGSWGAFYSISALWFLRCTIFGFGGKDLQTVSGFTEQEKLAYYGKQVVDSKGNEIPSPTYKGIQSLVEYLYFHKAKDMKSSLHDSESVRLFTSSPVSAVKRNKSTISITACGNTEKYDYVFVNSSQWASQMSFSFTDFPQAQLPQEKITAEHTQHIISSCKLFFPLTEQYWNKKGNRIPQVIVTDTFIQDAYAFGWDKSDNGVILASYTWEDDSLKLLPYDEKTLADKVLKKLQEITLKTVGQDVTEYIRKDKRVMIQWIKEPSYGGCSKLYRQRDEAANTIDLSYNQDYGKKSQLYFAGESYSVEGGWTEPALRSALDGVMQLLNHIGAEFQVEGFDFKRDYPKWDLKY